MATLPQNNRVLQAIEALKALDRNQAISLLQTELRVGPTTGDVWLGVSRLAKQIGEIDISVEALRRYALTSPSSLERQLQYWGELASVGRSETALAEIDLLSVGNSNHPNILHFLGTIAGERGHFAEAEEYFRKSIFASPNLLQTWFALAMIKTFSADDPDLALMERVRRNAMAAGPELHARFLYGLAKAYRDCSEFDKAFALNEEGAALKCRQLPFDASRLSRFADQLISDFDPEGIGRLLPSNNDSSRVIFVNGLPRSGSTLIEQILTSHSQVADGGELNFLRAALIPTGDYSFGGAIEYQRRTKMHDPWHDLADHYHRMISMRFGKSGRIVDKTLSQSQFMGLLLHILPKAKVIWVRRAPQDAALSCFQTFFSAPIPWSWSFETIGQYFKIEDRLFEHWTKLFPDRILVVPYEELVSDQQKWIPQMLEHADLRQEPEVYEFHTNKRSVRTASVQQVRQPISKSRINSARGHEKHLVRFWDSYRA